VVNDRMIVFHDERSSLPVQIVLCQQCELAMIIVACCPGRCCRSVADDHGRNWALPSVNWYIGTVDAVYGLSQVCESLLPVLKAWRTQFVCSTRHESRIRGATAGRKWEERQLRGLRDTEMDLLAGSIATDATSEQQSPVDTHCVLLQRVSLRVKLR
jgi:hypothetical protein